MAKQIGDRGEKLVVEILQANGWKILETQWRCRWGELDIIACDRQWLLFIEVKTRGDQNWDEDGLLAIAPDKQAKLIKAASEFLGKYPQMATLACRFDVALVRCSDRVKDGTNAKFWLQTYIEQAFGD